MGKVIGISTQSEYESPILAKLKEMDEKRAAKALAKYLKALKEISKKQIQKVS